MILLDTCVLSELRKSAPDPKVIKAIRSLSIESAYLSVITVGEIINGFSRLPDGRKKDLLKQWFELLYTEYKQRIIPIDETTARLWGAIAAAGYKKGYQLSTSDGLIAATAKQYHCTLWTRNIKDFRHTEIPLYNPWD